MAWLATSQRLDLTLTLKNDGLHSYGPGIWPFHDHQYQGITNDGIGPGGNISAIVYRPYLDARGWPATKGVSWQPYFSEAYYRKEIPIWESYAPGLFSDTGTDWLLLARLLGLSVAFASLAALVIQPWLAGRMK